MIYVYINQVVFTVYEIIGRMLVSENSDSCKPILFSGKRYYVTFALCRRKSVSLSSVVCL